MNYLGAIPEVSLRKITTTWVDQHTTAGISGPDFQHISLLLQHCHNNQLYSHSTHLSRNFHPTILSSLCKSTENLTSRDTFYRSNHLINRQRWNTLNQKMNMILICANLNKFYLKTTSYFQAYLLDLFTDRTMDHLAPVLHRKNQKVKKRCLVVLFEYLFIIHKANVRFSCVLKTLGFQTMLFDPGASLEEFFWLNKSIFIFDRWRI